MAQNKNKDLDKKKHSLAHILAMAVLDLYADKRGSNMGQRGKGSVQLGIGPTIENGFYYDFDFQSKPAKQTRKEEKENREINAKKSFISEEDLPRIEERMKELISHDLKFKKEIITFEQAKKLFKNQKYKLELIKELKEQKKAISIYGTFGKDPKEIFVDLCSGPHVESTKEINKDAFKLVSLAGAYWRGSEKNPMLTRIYGAAFNTPQELSDYLNLLEEAKKRDHRVLGEKMDLFMVDENIGKGLPLWLPKGYLIRRLIEDYIYKVEQENGYLHVLTPELAKEVLYKTSGHLAHYKEDMYSPIEIENEKYYLRPMNCPHHHSIYKHQLRSYKDLPLRIAEFGTVYRYERSGVLSGLIRVRGFTQNDAHIYITPEKLEEEIIKILAIHKKVFDDFKITDYWFRLSLPDFKNKEKYGDIKNKKMWEQGTGILKKVLNKQKIKFIEGVGEATFYGPKIDIQIKNIYGKEDTIATIQVDYYSAGRFNLSYIDKDGKEKPVIIIHRAILGSFERFFAFLLEKTGGDLPLWLAPAQVRIINIGEGHRKYAEDILNEFVANKIRAELSGGDLTVSKRIREAELQKIPYILVVGDKEVQNKTVNVRHYKRGQEGEIRIKDLINQIKKEINEKR